MGGIGIGEAEEFIIGTSHSLKRCSIKPITWWPQAHGNLLLLLLLWETEFWEVELGEEESLLHTGSLFGKPRVNTKDNF